MSITPNMVELKTAIINEKLKTMHATLQEEIGYNPKRNYRSIIKLIPTLNFLPNSTHKKEKKKLNIFFLFFYIRKKRSDNKLKKKKRTHRIDLNAFFLIKRLINLR